MLATAICRRISSPELRVSGLLRLSQSICVDSASQENLTIAALKDAVRLLVYLLATALVGALLAPPLFWGAQSLASHGPFHFLARFDFETFFHRALLIAAVILLWPFTRSLSIRNLADLQLEKNRRWSRDLVAGFIFSAVPLLCCGAILLATPVYSLRGAVNWPGVFKMVAAAAVVPIIEEIFFRGFILGILLKTGRRCLPVLVTSALYSIVHFLKAPEHTSTIVTWTSGFNSIAHAFVQFADPMLVAAGFTTLFLIGWILAGRAVANSLALVADRFARGLDPDQWRFQQDCVAPVNRSSLAREEFPGGDRSSRRRRSDLAHYSRLVEICRCSQNLIFFARSLLWFIRRPAPFVRHRSDCGNICASIVKQSCRELCRHFARNARNHSTARSRTRSPVPTAAHRVLYFDAAVSAYRSRGIARHVILNFKYGRQIHLRHLVARWLMAALNDARLRDRKFDAIVPVPLHPARQRERGFNQAALLAERLAPRLANSCETGPATGSFHDHPDRI